MDSGYESEDVMSWNEGHGVGYVIKMTMRGELWPKIFFVAKQNYRKIYTEAGEVELFSFDFKRDTWSKDRRVVVVRWKEEADRRQTNLFDELG